MVAPLVPQAPSSLALPAYASYRIKRPFWSWLGRRFHVYDASGMLVAYVRHPLMRFRDEFVIYADESETRPLAKIKARQIVSFQLTYDVSDPETFAFLGTLRKRGLKSLIRDTWEILGPNDRPVGVMEEEGLSWLRRFFPILLGRWKVEHEGRKVGQITQLFRFFVKEYVLEWDGSPSSMDPRFGIACALLALMAETRREG